MYDELIAELRQHHCDAKEDDTQEVCEECRYDVIIVDKSAPSGIASVCVCGLMNRAADAIEELQGKIEELYCLAQDVNRNEIAGHISENNLDAWLYAFQRYAAKIAKKPLPEPPKEE